MTVTETAKCTGIYSPLPSDIFHIGNPALYQLLHIPLNILYEAAV